jgi:hypothetical protein
MRVPYSLPEDVLRDVVSRLSLAWRGVVAGSGAGESERAPALVA